jgi:hypothetical protein
VITPSSGKLGFFRRATTVGTRPSGFQASSAPGVFLLPSTTGNNARAGTPSFKAFSATGNRRSSDMRSTPGIEATASVRSRALEDEHGIDQVVGRQCVLTHQAPREVVATHPPHPGSGKYTFCNHCLSLRKYFQEIA